MRVQPLIGLGLSAAMVVLGASCNPPAQPPYADISWQTRCLDVHGDPIASCSSPVQRDIFGFSGDMGQRFSCTIAENATSRVVNFTVTARTGTTSIGMTLSGATVPIAGGPVSTSCNFQWTDGNTYGGTCGAGTPTDAQPCQVSNISFTTDTATGLPLMDVNVLCLGADSIPIMMPAQERSLTRPGNMGGEAMMPMTVHFYSCPVIHR